jgi:hypothetical protein
LGDLSDRPAGLHQVQHLRRNSGGYPRLPTLRSCRLGSTEPNNTTPPAGGKTKSSSYRRPWRTRLPVHGAVLGRRLAGADGAGQPAAVASARLPNERANDASGRPCRAFEDQSGLRLAFPVDATTGTVASAAGYFEFEPGAGGCADDPPQRRSVACAPDVRPRSLGEREAEVQRCARDEPAGTGRCPHCQALSRGRDGTDRTESGSRS